MIKKIRWKLILDLLTIIFLLFLPYYLFEGKLFVGGDDTRLFYAYPFEYLKQFSFFSWVNGSSIGTNGASQYLLPFISIWSFVSLIISNRVILDYFAFSLPLIFAFVYFKKFVEELFNFNNNHNFEIYIGSLFFILSPIIIYDQLFIFLTTVWLLGVVPAVGYYYLKYLKSSNFLYIYISLIICCIFSFVILSFPWILGFLIPFFIGVLVLATISTRKEIVIFSKRTIAFIIPIVLAQAFWLFGFIVPYFVQDKNSFAAKLISKDFLDTFTPTVLATAKGYIIYPLLNLFHRQIAFDFGWKLKDIFVDFYDKIFILNSIFILILLIGILSYRKYFNKKERRIYLLALIAFIVSLYLFTVNIGPLKDLFLLFGNIPGFIMFRNFYDKFAPGYIFIYGILITLGLILIKKRFNNRFKWVNLVILLLILFNFTTVKPIVNSPLWTTDNIYKTINIPEEYLSFMNTINKNVSPSNTILSIPFGLTVYSSIKDENSNNTYVGVSPVKLFSGINDISGDMSFSFTNENIRIDNAIIERKYDALNEILYNYNINYVLVTKNIPGEVLKSYVYNQSTLGKQDEEFLNGITSEKIFTSEKGNYELYTTKKRNILLQSKNLSFEKINPVKYFLYLENVKSGQELKFNETFHNDWKLYLQKNPNLSFCSKAQVFSSNNIIECKSNFNFFDLNEMTFLWEKSIFDNSHATTKGFSNTWVMDTEYIRSNYSKDYYTINKDGSLNLKIILYFNQQLYFYYGVIISLIVILLATGYLAYLLFKKNGK